MIQVYDGDGERPVTPRRYWIVTQGERGQRTWLCALEPGDQIKYRFARPMNFLPECDERSAPLFFLDEYSALSIACTLGYLTDFTTSVSQCDP